MPEPSHTCSRHPERCPACGHEDSRDGFEGLEGTARDIAHRVPKFVVRCPECEALHPDQSNHDHRECDACSEEILEGDRRYLERRS
jgi:hypothetical protein